jgi:hypothetical protein
LRNPQVGFISTVTQYDALTPAGVLTRLVSMRQPALASRLAVSIIQQEQAEGEEDSNYYNNQTENNSFFAKNTTTTTQYNQTYHHLLLSFP